MVEAREVLSDIANVGQLTGLNALELIVRIGEAANNVWMHRSKCLRFSRWLKLQRNVLKLIMADAAWMKNPETREPLERLEDELRGAWVLVNSCQNRNYLHLLATGWIISRKLKESREEIEDLLRMIPLVKIAVESTDKMAAIVGFKELLCQAQEAEDITNKTKFKEFAIKYGNDERFEDLDHKERKRLFKERVDELEEEVKDVFKLMLRERGDINSSSHWSMVCDNLRSDPRYEAVKIADREALFDEHVAEMRSAEQNTESTAEAKSKEEVENNARLYMHKGLGKMQHQLQKLFKYTAEIVQVSTCLCKR